MSSMHCMSTFEYVYTVAAQHCEFPHWGINKEISYLIIYVPLQNKKKVGDLAVQALKWTKNILHSISDTKKQPGGNIED